MEISEATIIRRYQAGDLKEFGILYDKYIKKIYDFIYFKTMHKQTAEDLTSQTFFKALSHLDKFDEAKGSFSSWLYRIARNNVIDHYRVRKNEANIEDIWDLSGQDDIEKDLDVKEQLARVREYLQKLPASQRDVVILRIWGGLSYQEIAGVVGKNEDNCKMIFSRTVAKLRREQTLALLLLIMASIVK